MFLLNFTLKQSLSITAGACFCSLDMEITRDFIPAQAVQIL
jgi:hypothetical protein